MMISEKMYQPQQTEKIKYKCSNIKSYYPLHAGLDLLKHFRHYSPKLHVRTVPYIAQVRRPFKQDIPVPRNELKTGLNVSKKPTHSSANLEAMPPIYCSSIEKEDLRNTINRLLVVTKRIHHFFTRSSTYYLLLLHA